MEIAYTTGNTTAGRPSNRLLAALSVDDFLTLATHLRPVSLTSRQVLNKQDEPIRQVIFPTGGVCSLIRHTGEGKSVEVAMVGNEGALGTVAFFGDTEAIAETVVLTRSGAAYVMPLDAFQKQMDLRGGLYRRILRYNQTLLAQVVQIAVCNAVHSGQARCCRWLLMHQDRVHTDEFPLTQDLLAAILGLRRPTITYVAASLQSAGLIDYRRGYFRITDRRGVEAMSCECYATVKTTCNRLLPEIDPSDCA